MFFLDDTRHVHSSELTLTDEVLAAIWHLNARILTLTSFNITLGLRILQTTHQMAARITLSRQFCSLDFSRLVQEVSLCKLLTTFCGILPFVFPYVFLAFIHGQSWPSACVCVCVSVYCLSAKYTNRTQNTIPHLSDLYSRSNVALVCCLVCCCLLNDVFNLFLIINKFMKPLFLCFSVSGKYPFVEDKGIDIEWDEHCMPLQWNQE